MDHQQGFVVGVGSRGRPIEGSSDHFAVVDHGELVMELVVAGKVRGADASDELQVVGSEFRSTFEYGNDATIAKAFVCAVFVEVKPTFLLIIEEVKILFCKLLFDHFFVFASGKGGRAIDTKAVSINF